MPQIPLSRGMVALVDEIDLPLLEPFKWCASENRKPHSVIWYALANTRKPDGGRTMLKMHRLIMAALPGQLVDHRNHNGLDNRRGNLRVTNTLQNTTNARSHRGYKGVSRGKSGRWRAAITVSGKYTHLGVFEDPWEAALAYNAAASEAWGEHAYLNIQIVEGR
jgi:hypothetical protein